MTPRADANAVIAELSEQVSAFAREIAVLKAYIKNLEAALATKKDVQVE